MLPPIQGNVVIQDRRASTVVTHPRAVAQKDRRIAAGALVVRLEQASKDWFNAKRG
jgi:hypothetical protein